MKFEINLNKIKKLSEKNDEENWNFRSFLKGCDATIEEIDSIVYELYQKISSEIDCTICANCCKEVQPVLDQEDIIKCCGGIGISVSQFKKKYLKFDKEERNFVFRLWGVVENCSICPIVFNVYEQLKEELWYSGDGRLEDDQEDIRF
jgi:hypothetical protein